MSVVSHRFYCQICRIYFIFVKCGGGKNFQKKERIFLDIIIYMGGVHHHL